VQCIVHTHAFHVAALSMLEAPLVVSHMDLTPLYDDCAFLPDWPGVPVGNEEGEIISAALGHKKAVLLARHGHVIAGAAPNYNWPPWPPAESGHCPKSWLVRPTTGP